MLPIDNSGVMIDPQGPVVGSMAFQVQRYYNFHEGHIAPPPTLFLYAS